MLMYHLFYNVQNSKKSYSVTKAFMCESDALNEAAQLQCCDNVKFISIRCVDVHSISLNVIKGGENEKN